MTDPSPGPEGEEIDRIEARSYFVRQRNALAIRCHFSPLYTDHYLHLMQHGIKLDPELDLLLKEALAAFTLHLVARPIRETIAWTLNFQDPLCNLFVTGGSLKQRVVGRVFTEDVKQGGENTFFSQIAVPDQPVRQSVINFAGRDPFSIVEQYYRQSEQRVARFFEHSPEDYVFISAQPQCDLEWLESLDTDNVRNLDQNEEMSLLETRMFGYDCGCTIDKIIPALSRLSPDEMEDLFQNDQAIAADCPRCAARFHITRESIQDWMDRQGRKS